MEEAEDLLVFLPWARTLNLEGTLSLIHDLEVSGLGRTSMGHGDSAVPAFVDVAWVLLLPGHDLSFLGRLGSLGQRAVLQSWRGLSISGEAQWLAGWDVF